MLVEDNDTQVIELEPFCSVGQQQASWSDSTA